MDVFRGSGKITQMNFLQTELKHGILECGGVGENHGFVHLKSAECSFLQ